MAYLVLVLVSLLFLKVVFVETRVPVEQLIKECSDLRQTIVCDPDGILNNASKFNIYYVYIGYIFFFKIKLKPWLIRTSVDFVPSRIFFPLICFWLACQF